MPRTSVIFRLRMDATLARVARMLARERSGGGSAQHSPRAQGSATDFCGQVDRHRAAGVRSAALPAALRRSCITGHRINPKPSMYSLSLSLFRRYRRPQSPRSMRRHGPRRVLHRIPDDPPSPCPPLSAAAAAAGIAFNCGTILPIIERVVYKRRIRRVRRYTKCAN